MSVLLENTQLVTFIRNHIRDTGGVFSISIDQFTDIVWLLNRTCCMMEKSPDLAWKSSAIFGPFSETFVWLSDNFWRSFGILPEVVGNLRKIVKASLSACLYNKQKNTWLLVDMEYLFSFSTLYLTRSLRSLVRYRIEHSVIFHIYAHPCIIYLPKLCCIIFKEYKKVGNWNCIAKLSSCDVRHLSQFISCLLGVVLYVSRLMRFVFFCSFFILHFSKDCFGSCLVAVYYVYGSSARVSADRNALLM